MNIEGEGRAELEHYIHDSALVTLLLASSKLR
jgi:hypothetical protein